MIKNGDKYEVICDNCFPLVIAEIPINPFGITTMEVIIYNDEIVCKPYVCPKCGNIEVITFFDDSHRDNLSIEEIH